MKIAVAGLGTVGAAVVRQLRENADLIAARAGRRIEIKAVSAQDKARKRDCDLSGIAWIDDPRGLSSVAGVDAVVELMGGAEGAARATVEAALASGKHVVTANKALIAACGPALARLAEANKAQLSFEASVAGGIPVIKALREALAGDRVDLLYGILNGTCNYILTRMQEAGIDFAAALAGAQKRGYAEADPASDIGGHDAANKLAVLASLAFGIEPDLAAIRTDGIGGVTLLDLQLAQELGCRVKLLGVARQTPDGVEQWVGPALVSESLPLAHVDGALNSVLVRGRCAGDITLQGRGAGGEPTASAVIADLIDIARGFRTCAFSVPATQLCRARAGSARPARHYIRLHAADRPGVVAAIAAVLRDEAISIESLIQRGQSQQDSVPVTITTHAGDGAAARRAVEKIAALPAVTQKPCLMPIEDCNPL